MEANPPFSNSKKAKFEVLGKPPSSKPKPSIKEPPIFNLKPLPSHLKYAFLEKFEKLPIIISLSLIRLQEEKFLRC